MSSALTPRTPRAAVLAARSPYVRSTLQRGNATPSSTAPLAALTGDERSLFTAVNNENSAFAVTVDLLEVEDWDKRIKGLLHQKANNDKEKAQLNKQLEQFAEQCRAREEMLRLATRDLSTARAKIDGLEDTRNQLLRDKTALLAENTALRNDNKAIRTRHDKLEIELQKTRLQMDRDKDLTLRAAAKGTTKEVAQLRKDYQRLQAELEVVPQLRSEIAAREQSLQDARRVIALLQAQSAGAASTAAQSKTTSTSAANDAVMELRARLDEQTRLNEALRQEVMEARSIRQDASVHTLLEAERVQTREKLRAMLDECESIVAKAEAMQRASDERVREAEERLTQMRRAQKDKELAMLKEKLDQRALEKDLREQLATQDARIAALVAEIHQVRSDAAAAAAARPVQHLDMLDASFLTTCDSEDEDIDMFNQRVSRAAKKSRLSTMDSSISEPPIASSDVFVAAASYSSTTDDDSAVPDLHFKEGDRVMVTQKSEDGWWQGRLVLPDGQLSAPGRFPGTFLRGKRKAAAM